MKKRSRPRAPRAPTSTSTGSPSPIRAKKVGNRGARVVANGGEPIYIGRVYADAKVPNKNLPASEAELLKYVQSEVLPKLGLDSAKKWTEQQCRDVFVATYARCGNVRLSAWVVGVNRLKVEVWRVDVEGFRLAMDLAYEDAVDRLEEVARKWSVDGRSWVETVEKSVVDANGKPLGEVERTTKSGTEVDTSLLKMLLSKRYGSKVELSGPEGGPIELREVEVHVVDQKEESARA